MEDVDTLIIGGGVAGIACLASLPPSHSSLLLEAEPDIGGLLRAYRFGEYVFDTVPHVLFFRDKALLAATKQLLGVPMHEFRRTNVIWQNGNIIAYPYQFNACHLPVDIRNDCLEGMRAVSLADRNRGRTFKQWLLGQFGTGFYSHFFKPYNEKLYGTDLSALEAGPLRWTIPRDNSQAVLSGAERPHPVSNELLYYPAGKRAIAAIVDSLAEPRRTQIRTNQRVVAIDSSRREAMTATGDRFRYCKVISTQPLPQLVRGIVDAPSSIRRLADELRAVSIHVIRIGTRHNGPGLRNIWTYFPDPELPFYRMTRLEHISPDLCAPGAASILLESSSVDPPSQEAVVRFLRSAAVITSNEIDHFSVLTIPFAYVLFLRGFRKPLREIREFLEKAGVITAGRYGAWMYADIEMALKSGISAARRVLEPGERLSSLVS
ncbi:MAG: FAD-dependent oxidoreductase [Betaproteobacteria bacterium]